MEYRRLQGWVLRAVGVVECFAFAAVVMPRSWMEAGHAALGFSTPEGPVFESVMRQVSFSYGLHGVGMWFIGSDVTRYRPLVLLSCVGYLLAGPVFFLVDFNLGMPWLWIAGNAGSCTLIGVLLLALLCAEQRAATSRYNDSE